jgi:hypothetical protein
MAFDAINITDAMWQRYEEMVVLLGPEDGTAPAAEAFENVYCSMVVQSAGSRIDYADLKWALREPLQDREQPASFARMVQIELPDLDFTRMHLGDYISEGFRVDQTSESLSATSQLRPYHYGGPVTGYRVWDAIDSEQREIADDIVFNPMIDDKTVFNRSNRTRSVDPGDGFVSYLWTHPELADSAVGEAYQDQTRNEWTLLQAVQSLIELLNPDEEFLARPVTVDFDVLNESPPPIRNVRIEIGTYLPQALDKILIPLGFNHWIDYGQPKPQIVFFKIGVGEEKELLFPRAELYAELDIAEANVNQLVVSNSIGDSFNQVIVYGDFEEAEITIPIYPGWPAAADELSPGDLSKDGEQYPTNQTAWRLFIGNEAGDIDPAVARLGQTPTVPDFGGVFTIATPHRRVFGEPLTYQNVEGLADGKPQRQPLVIEYSIDGGNEWLPSEEGWTIKQCPDQLGILFDGKTIPSELYDAGSNGRLRVTGTIKSDYRCRGYAAKQSWAVNGRVVEQVLLMPEKFQRRFRYQESGGLFSSVLTGMADERDDRTEAEDYAEKIRDQNHYADMDCEFRLPGWHLQYAIGDLITKVAGREISIDAAPESAPVRRYVQIVERRYEMSADGGPSTVLIVDRGVVQT